MVDEMKFENLFELGVSIGCGGGSGSNFTKGMDNARLDAAMAGVVEVVA